MTRLKLYYGGWLTLPAALRQQLALGTDAVLEAELVDGSIVLRSATGKPAVPGQEASPAPGRASPVSEPELPLQAEAPARRKPGRPRKIRPAAEPELRLEQPANPPEPVRRGPGRPRKTPSAPVGPSLKVRGRRKVMVDGALSSL